LADGWLGAAVTPVEAGAARVTIAGAAAEAGRTIDPEHFGLSIPYARTEPSAQTVAALQARRPDADPGELLPVGAQALRALVSELVDQGLSKFVVRPVAPVSSWTDELSWLGDTLLELQT
ncbi:MAG: putative F420-dependent oxidoreductase, family, partial [Actinomycetia bacterium]|nr:putative F420-dependent oxidoreductase, family [Actinomycetes bacterium]